MPLAALLYSLVEALLNIPYVFDKLGLRLTVCVPANLSILVHGGHTVKYKAVEQFHGRSNPKHGGSCPGERVLHHNPTANHL